MASILAILGLVCYLVATVCAIIILIHAFQEEVLQGILCLCVPFYALYYAFARYNSENKGLIIGGWLGLGILGAILLGASGAMAGDAGGGAGGF